MQKGLRCATVVAACKRANRAAVNPRVAVCCMGARGQKMPNTTKIKRIYRRGRPRRETSQLSACGVCNRAIGGNRGFEQWEDDRGQILVRHTERLYVDECADDVRSVLRKMGFCVAPSCPKGTPDVQWLAHVGQEGHIAITQDAKIAENPAEMQALIDNRVRCFILPGDVTGTWDLVRNFAAMWDKIRGESVFPGPFVWRFDDRKPTPWEQVYPKPNKHYRPHDFSRAPVGHLLNLFADVVCQHDDGWFDEAYVQGLHDHIGKEVQARISGDRSEVPRTAPATPLVRMDAAFEAGSTQRVDLETPLDTSNEGTVEIWAEPEPRNLTYSWLVPIRRLRYYVDPSDGIDPETAYHFS